MSLSECAAAAVHFPNRNVATPQGTLPLGLMMLCVGGSESNWNTNARGDYGLPGPQCDGYTSWGWLQIHSVHSGYLTRATGSDSPCVWANWLYDPLHTVQAATFLLGLRTSYTWQQIVGPGAPWQADEETWQQYLPAAKSAWQATVSVAGPPQPPLRLTATGVAVATAGLLAGGAVSFAVERHRHSSLARTG
jgi:hypothetical protein